jgi:hypothetical protein
MNFRSISRIRQTLASRPRSGRPLGGGGDALGTGNGPSVPSLVTCRNENPGLSIFWGSSGIPGGWLQDNRRNSFLK